MKRGGSKRTLTRRRSMRLYQFFRGREKPFPHYMPMGCLSLPTETKGFITPPSPYEKVVLAEVEWESFHLGKVIDFLVSIKSLGGEMWLEKVVGNKGRLSFQFDQEQTPDNKTIEEIFRRGVTSPPRVGPDGIRFKDLTTSRTKSVLVKGKSQYLPATLSWFPLSYLLLFAHEKVGEGGYPPYYWIQCAKGFLPPPDAREIPQSEEIRRYHLIREVIVDWDKKDLKLLESPTWEGWLWRSSSECGVECLLNRYEDLKKGG